MLQKVICWMLIAVTPAAMLAADTGSGPAMLYGRGPVGLNGKPLPNSSAVFPGDVIETQPESVGTLDASGSGVVIFPDSLIKFEGNAVSVEHGAVSVATSKGMVGLAREVTVTPASNGWTEFEVVDMNGTVQILANKGSVNVNCRKGTVNLSEGEYAFPDKSGKCSKGKRKPGTPVPGDDSILTNPFVIGSELVGGGVIVCLLLCNVSKPFLSQWKP